MSRLDCNANYRTQSTAKRWKSENTSTLSGLTGLASLWSQTGLCGGVQAKVIQMKRALVIHSLFMPYLLLVFQSALRNTQNLDIEKLDAHMQAIGQSLREADSEIEMRFSRAITMLGNSRDDLRRHVSRLSSAMTAIQAGASSVPQFTPLEVDPEEQV